MPLNPASTDVGGFSILTGAVIRKEIGIKEPTAA